MRLKCVLIGETEGGKSSILHRLLNDSFDEKYDPTIGVDFYAHKIELEGKSLKLQLWDSSGQEKYRSLTPSYIRGSAMAFIIFDITKEIKFLKLTDYLKDLKAHGGDDILITLVGNKMDLVDNKVSSLEEINDFARKNYMKYFEVSAKTGYNVSEVFSYGVREVLKNKYNIVAKEKNEEQPKPRPQNEEQPKPHPLSLEFLNKNANVNILLYGMTGVGKTSMMIRCLFNSFIDANPSVNVDYFCKVIKLDSKEIRLNFIDCSGESIKNNIDIDQFQGVNCCLLMYDISNTDSFDLIKNSLPKIKNIVKCKSFAILVGNKEDISNRYISYEDGHKLAKENNMNFFEISCKNDKNVKELFNYTIKTLNI